MMDGMVIDITSQSSSSSVSSETERSVGRFRSDGAHRLLKDGRYLLAETAALGKGEFSSVVRAHDNVLNVDVALKIIKADTLFADSTAKEIDTLRALMLARTDALDYFTPLLDHFRFDNHEVLVLPAYDGDLYHYMKEKYHHTVVPLSVVKHICRSILRGMQVLSDIGFVHADLKLDNVLVRSDRDGDLCKIVLGDFGACSKKGCAQNGFAQTTCYRDPLLVLGQTLHCKSDVYSFGVGIFWELLFDCRQLFRVDNKCDSEEQEYLGQVQDVFGRYPESMHASPAVPQRRLPPLKDLVTRLVPGNETVRESIVNIMRRCCKYNIRQRASPSSLLRDAFFA